MLSDPTAPARETVALRGSCAAYDRYRSRAEFRAVRALLPAVRADWRVLDAGCGPGRWTEHLARRCASVVAFDVSTRMLEMAREACDRAGVLARVAFVRGRLEEPHPDVAGPFSLVLVMGALQYVADADVASAIGRLAGAVGPGGFLVHRESRARMPFVKTEALPAGPLVSHYRQLSTYVDAYRRHGLVVVARRSILPPHPLTAMLARRAIAAGGGARRARLERLLAGVLAARERLVDRWWDMWPSLVWAINSRRATDQVAVLLRRPGGRND